MSRIVAKCPDCEGKGWTVPAVNEWPDPCPWCEGRGNLTRARLASLFARGADRDGESRELYYRAIEAVERGGPLRRRGVIVLAAIERLFPGALSPKTAARYA